MAEPTKAELVAERASLRAKVWPRKRTALGGLGTAEILRARLDLIEAKLQRYGPG